jgi:indolepyruvate ferredoxin oxidoreductase beta subunit
MTAKTFEDQKVISFLLCGVGGQGTILASNVLAELGMKLGYDVKQAEVHGMSQRGGSVTSHVRWGEKVYSPIITQGDADVFISFEKSEVGRYLDGIKPGGLALINDYSIIPITVSSGGATYPQDALIREAVERYTDRSYWIKGVEIAEKLGNTKAANVVILGALSAALEMDPQAWLEVIEKRVPQKHIEVNRKAFHAGREAVKSN